MRTTDDINAMLDGQAEMIKAEYDHLTMALNIVESDLRDFYRGSDVMQGLLAEFVRAKDALLKRLHAVAIPALTRSEQIRNELLREPEESSEADDQLSETDDQSSVLQPFVDALKRAGIGIMYDDNPFQIITATEVGNA